ncbi:MAG: DegT/DnrJ/EryC1/StrS family aminotransferase [Planctomycetota bacterium]|jgi:perosamine synthetase
MIDEIPLSKPDIGREEIELVNTVMRSGRLAMGPMIEEFEALVSRRVGTTHAIAVSSGTAGLHLVLEALGVGPGDEVITTPFSFVASSNCILQVGATPVFVDIHPTSLNMDPSKIEGAMTDRTRAILAVEAFGNPAHMEEYRALAARHEIPLVEDSCEGLGGSWKRRKIGSFGRAGVFGFYPNKQITTGEGGMIVTDDDALADLCRSMRNQGRPIASRSHNPATGPSQPLHHERMGFNYRLSEVHAAIGVAQMRRLDAILEKRSIVARTYIHKLMGKADIMLPTIDEHTSMSWFVFVLRLASSYSREDRDRIVAGLRRHDIGAADYFPCIHLQKHYRERFGYSEGSFPIAESVSSRTIALPFHTQITPREIEFVVQTIELMMTRENLKRS